MSATPYIEAGHALRQIRLASTGAKLGKLTDEQHPPEMYAGSVNNHAARIRAAYWQAVGSRMAQARGQSSTALTTGATTDFGTANMAGTSAMSMMNPLYWAYRPTSRDQVASVTNKAVTRLRAAGLFDVAAVLASTADRKAVQLQQGRVTAAGGYDPTANALLDQLDMRPDWAKTQAFNWTLYGLGGLLALGLAASLVRWAIGPYVGAARGAARSVRSMRGG